MGQELDFLSEQALLYTSKQYEDIYIHFNEAMRFSYQDLFILFAAVGAKHNRKEEFSGRGREFRANYFNRDQRDLAYTIILNDDDLGKNIDVFSEKEFNSTARRKLEQYAQGGATLLLNEVFRSHWDGNKLSRDYGEYEIDLLTFVHGKLEEMPF